MSFARVVDDFEDGFRAGWFDFATGLGGSVTETFGVLGMDVPVGRARGPVFVATSRAGERMALEPGQPLELRINVVSTTSTEVFAVLAWVPDGEPLSQFAGYFVAKSATEIRVGKALHKCFWSETPAVQLKRDNVTLALTLQATDGNVAIRAQVLDPEAGGVVLFERTFTDTPAADALARGTDSPAAPWTGSGQMALMGYSEGGMAGGENAQLVFDEAEASTPAPANLRPVFHDLAPTNTASFLPQKTSFLLRATDDQRWWENGPGAAGALFTGGPFSAMNLSLVSGTDGKTLQVNTLGNLQPNTNYTIGLVGVDAAHASNVFFLRIDTFCPASRIIEIEDYNFNGGQFLDSPGLIPEGDGPTSSAYPGQAGVAEVDFHDSNTAAGVSLYRPNDPVATRRSLDYRRPWFVEAGDGAAEVFDYDVHGIEAGEHLVYTRTFGPGEYEVYLRQAVLNLELTEAVLERETRTPEGGETVTELGRFVAGRSGFEYRNVPLRDTSGQLVKVRLEGLETLRLRQLTSAPADAAILQNYLVFASPASECVVIESAPTVAGPFTADPAAYVAGQTVTVWLPPSGARFYQSRSKAFSRIVNVRRSGQSVVFDLE